MRFVSPSWRRILGAVLVAGLIRVAAAGREQEPLGQTGRGQKPVSSGVGGGVGRSPFTEEYRRHVEGLLEELHVPGVAIAVVDGDDAWTEGYGLAILDPPVPVTPRTLFYCASTTKAQVAAAFAIMIESGNYTVPAGLPGPSAPLAWDTPIAAIIPDDFVLADPWATTHVTLEDALSHRTGLPRHDKATAHMVADPTRRTATVRDGVRALRYLPLSAAPRTRWQYCNHMYGAAGHAAEALAGGGRRLGELLRAWLWTPLGMGRTYFSLEEALAAPEDFASGYGWDRRGQRYVAVPQMPTDEVGGAGSVISCAEDYAKWVRMMLRGDGPLPPAGHRAVKTPRIMVDPEAVLDGESPYDGPVAYALGWETSSYRGQRFWTHAGGMHAFGAEIFFFPGLDLGVVVLGNTATTSNALELQLVWEMVDDRLGVPEGERHDWGAAERNSEQEMEARIDGAVDKYYPDRPSPPIPPALPVSAYAGTYFHPGYLNFTLQDPASAAGFVTRDGISLVALRFDATWPTVNEFQHVTGEHWMKFSSYRWNPTGPMHDFAPVRFEVGADGRVTRMGITWLDVKPRGEDIVEGLVWFDKIE